MAKTRTTFTVTHSHGWQVGAGSLQDASVPPHMGLSTRHVIVLTWGNDSRRQGRSRSAVIWPQMSHLYFYLIPPVIQMSPPSFWKETTQEHKYQQLRMSRCHLGGCLLHGQQVMEVVFPPRHLALQFVLLTAMLGCPLVSAHALSVRMGRREGVTREARLAIQVNPGWNAWIFIFCLLDIE